jgi:glycosyl transferase family 2
MLRQSIFSEVKPPTQDSPVTVCSIVKDEAFYLPAFLDHYRQLGVRQFIFLDDRSADGTREYLSDQADCAIITSELTYGQYVDGTRAHVFWRTELPRAYAQQGWALVVDVDEFLELPPGYRSITDLTHALGVRGASAVGAVMVDFYPARISDLDDQTHPTDKAELFARYPFFDDLPHGHWIEGKNKFRQLYGGVRDRLVKAYGVGSAAAPAKQSAARSVRKALQRRLGLATPKYFSAIHKVPLVRWSVPHRYVSSHTIERAPCSGMQLGLIHFKFTGSLVAKIDAAIASGAYHRQSETYYAYRALLSAMRDADGAFLWENSREYSCKRDLEIAVWQNYPNLRGEATLSSKFGRVWE